MPLQLTDNTERILQKNSPAYITLYTFREAVKRFFALEALPLVQSQDVKRHLKKGVDDANINVADLYPYSYYSLGSLGLVKDQQAVKTAARHSMGATFDELANAVLKKAFLFPCSIQAEVHYVTKDIIDAMNFCTRALIVAHSGKMNARVEYEGVSWIVEVKLDSESIPIPRSDKDLEADPEGMDLVLSFTINTKLGAMRDVPKVNNRGEVTTGIEVKNG